jgi:ribosomal 50S subunit-recycling heat shock protein
LRVEAQRIDKWLWYARLARTRTLAQKLAVSGRVRVNRERNDSASRPVKPGDILTIAIGGGVRVLHVLGSGQRRGTPADAHLLYEELSPGATGDLAARKDCHSPFEPLPPASAAPSRLRKVQR